MIANEGKKTVVVVDETSIVGIVEVSENSLDIKWDCLWVNVGYVGGTGLSFDADEWDAFKKLVEQTNTVVEAYKAEQAERKATAEKEEAASGVEDAA